MCQIMFGMFQIMHLTQKFSKGSIAAVAHNEQPGFAAERIWEVRLCQGIGNNNRNQAITRESGLNHYR